MANNKFTNIIKNKVVMYLASRYVTYALQFLTSLVIAVKLGPYYMGIWGFVLLLLNYFQQFHFGISNSFNVLYIQNRDKKSECDNYIGNSLVLVSYLAFVIVFLYVIYSIIGFKGFEKYHAKSYMLWVCIIAILQHYTAFFVNLFRVKNLLSQVTICQSIVVFLNFICVFVFRGEALIFALIAGYVIGNLVALILAFFSGVLPSFSDVTINIRCQERIIKKGLFLFIYNSCFYLIIISIRTIISGYYTVEEFGLFTFSFSLAHAILLLLEALSFVVFPKILSKLSSPSTEERKSTISLYRNIYITSAHLLVYLALPFFPFLMFFFQKYSGAITALNLIALSIVINTNSCGYADLLIANNKEKTLMKLSFFALILNCLLGFVLVKVCQVGYSYVILATLATYFVYSFCVIVLGEKLLNSKDNRRILTEYFPFRLAIPFFCALCISLFQLPGLYYVVPLVLFLLVNVKMFTNIKETLKTLLFKPEIINL